MLKRERTSEERKLDVLLKRGIMCLGQTPAPAAEKPNAFTHFLAWDIKGRKGQRVRILKLNARLRRPTLVEFEDGFQMVVNRSAIHAIKGDSCSSLTSFSSSPSSSSR